VFKIPITHREERRENSRGLDTDLTLSAEITDIRSFDHRSRVSSWKPTDTVKGVAYRRAGE